MEESLLSSADSVSTVDEFKEWIRGRVRKIIPHDTFACGFGHIHAGGVALDGVVTIDYPIEHLETIRNCAGGIDTPILRRWLATREPQLFDPDDPWPGVPDQWLTSFRRHRLGRTAVHAVYDTERCVGTYHNFHRIPGPLSERLVVLLRETVPILHLVFCRVMERLNSENEFATLLAGLSPHEQETVCWLKLGKTNLEIAQLIGCSEGAVKQRLRRVFDKLGIENRAQIVRRLIEHENRRPVGYGTKYL